jgi:hypothetical protein
MADEHQLHAAGLSNAGSLDTIDTVLTDTITDTEKNPELEPEPERVLSKLRIWVIVCVFSLESTRSGQPQA